MNETISWFGWLPDADDERDHHFRADSALLRQLPPKVDLRPHCPPVFNQGEKIGSCTSNAVCNAFRYNLMRQHNEHRFSPSRLFLHYNARALAGTQRQNHGAQIRDAMKSLSKQGVCRESTWPYIAKHYAKKPPAEAYKQGLDHQSIWYQRLPRQLPQLKACLAEGFPFVFGMIVYEQFDSAAVAKTGVLHLPKKDEKKVGGHAVLAVGYDDKSERFIVMNSWGPDWGKNGYFTVPYDYLVKQKLGSDFWTLRSVEM